MVEALKIGLVQTAVLWNEDEKNLINYNELLDESSQKADIYVLPEMFNTGFNMNPENIAQSMDGPAIAWLSKQAKNRDALFVASVIIKDHSIRNRLVYAFPDGSISTYDKRHLFSMAGEHEKYSPGSDRIEVSFKGWKICGLICYDLRFPVFSRNSVKQINGKEVYGYDLLIYVANWPSPRRSAWCTLLEARAHENQSFVCGVNRVGEDENGFNYSGDSSVIGPKGEILGALKDESGILYVEIKKKELKDLREKFPILRDADRFELLG
ncbi:MAG: amidohydrolase [Flavobacteriales bacterium]|nr:amidohydrolase [Flavobacteriales bacterium]